MQAVVGTSIEVLPLTQLDRYVLFGLCHLDVSRGARSSSLSLYCRVYQVKALRKNTYDLNILALSLQHRDDRRRICGVWEDQQVL